MTASTDSGSLSKVSRICNSNERERCRERNASNQISVRKIHSDGTVDCELVCKQKAISFKFNRLDPIPWDFFESMMGEVCSKPSERDSLMQQLAEIIKRLNENPAKIPAHHRHALKVR